MSKKFLEKKCVVTFLYLENTQNKNEKQPMNKQSTTHKHLKDRKCQLFIDGFPQNVFDFFPYLSKYKVNVLK